MNKKPAPRPPFRYSFSLGVVVGVAFRIFAYVLLVIACSLPENRRFSPTASRVVELLYWGIALAALTSPFWVPFIAGFASVYFWGPLEEDDYKRAIWTSAISFFALSVIISRVVEILAFPCFLILFINLDVAMCGRGVGYGNRFWGSRLWRQFHGDFSTRDDEQEDRTNVL